MDKERTVPKWVLMGADSYIFKPNAPEFVCPPPKVLDFNKKRLHWVSVVHEQCNKAWKSKTKACIHSFCRKSLKLQ